MENKWRVCVCAGSCSDVGGIGNLQNGFAQWYVEDRREGKQGLTMAALHSSSDTKQL